MNPGLQIPDEGMTLEELSDFVGMQMKRLGVVLKNLDGLNIVDIKFELQGGAYIQLNRKGLLFFDGTKQTFAVDVTGQAVLTGVKVQTTGGAYPNIELDSSGNLLKASKSETEYIAINPDLTGSPTQIFETPNSKTYMYPDNVTGQFSLLALKGNMALNAQIGNLNLGAGDDVRLNPTADLLINGEPGWTGTFSAGTETVHVRKGIITDVT